MKLKYEYYNVKQLLVAIVIIICILNILGLGTNIEINGIGLKVLCIIFELPLLAVMIIILVEFSISNRYEKIKKTGIKYKGGIFKINNYENRLTFDVIFNNEIYETKNVYLNDAVYFLEQRKKLLFEKPLLIDVYMEKDDIYFDLESVDVESIESEDRETIAYNVEALINCLNKKIFIKLKELIKAIKIWNIILLIVLIFRCMQILYLIINIVL